MTTEHPNALIVRLDSLRATGQLPALCNDRTAQSYENLRAVCAAKNPVYAHLRQHMIDVAPNDPQAGVTREELGDTIIYTLARALPTVGEIGSLMNLFSQAKWFGPAKTVFENLQDELSGKQSHVELLYGTINQLGQKFQFSYLGPYSFPLFELILRARREMGIPDLGARYEDAEKLKQAYPDEVIFKLRVPLAGSTAESTFRNYFAMAARMADQLPPEADLYGREILRLSAEAVKNPTHHRHLCAGATRLGLRESSSAKEDGVVGTLAVPIDGTEGYFTPAEFRSLSKWHREHIAEDIGVEDRHQKDANALASRLITNTEPDQLDFIFNQEAALVACRNKLAADFHQCMAIARERATPDMLIKPRPRPDKGQAAWKRFIGRFLPTPSGIFASP